MVDEAIASAPATITLAARNPIYDFAMESDRVRFCAVGVDVTVVDLETGKVRESTKDDIGKMGRLADALGEYAICFDALLPRDVPAQTACLHGFDAFVNNSSKHIMETPMDKRTAEYLIEMAIAVKVGPRGNFLAEEHTLQHMRQVQNWPKLLDRSNREAWEGGRQPGSGGPGPAGSQADSGNSYSGSFADRSTGKAAGDHR